MDIAGMTNIFNPSNELVPHLICWNKTMDLIWLHVISDFIIAFSYLSIPTALLMIFFKRPDIPFKWLFFMFAMFIISCGLTHIMGIITVWYPLFWMDGYIKLSCAIISIITAISLYPLLPSIIGLKNKVYYEDAIEDLNIQIKNRDEIIDKIIKTNFNIDKLADKLK